LVLLLPYFCLTFDFTVIPEYLGGPVVIGLKPLLLEDCMLEKTLEAYLRNEVKKTGAVALKFVSPGRAGVPDRIVLAPGGRIYFVEMKRPGGKLRPLQQKVIADIRKLGFKVFVIDSREGVKEFIEILKGAIKNDIPCPTIPAVCDGEDNQYA